MTLRTLLDAPDGLRAVWATEDGVLVRPVLALGLLDGGVVPIVAYGGELRAAFEPWLVLTADEPDPSEDEALAEFLDNHPDFDREEDDDVDPA